MDLIKLVLNKEFSNLREEIVNIDYFKFKKYVHWVDYDGTPIISFMNNIFFIDGGVYIFLKTLLDIDDDTLNKHLSDWIKENLNLSYKKIMVSYNII